MTIEETGTEISFGVLCSNEESWVRKAKADGILGPVKLRRDSQITSV